MISWFPSVVRTLGCVVGKPRSAARAIVSALAITLAMTQPVFVASAPQRAAEDALTHAHAEARESRVANVRYRLSFDFVDAARTDTFPGTAILDFEVRAPGSPLTLDFSGGSLIETWVNGASAKLPYNGYFIEIPEAMLRTGRNEIRVRFAQSYGRDGTGLHRFVDPEDGKTYLYTYLWPYYANRVFPCFDQPNLKATFDLSVRVPRTWTAVSMQPGHVAMADGAARTWNFGTTPKISTYVFSIHAGPYQVWEERAGDVPIRLFSRQSLAPYVAVQEWFDVTRRGLTYFGEYFDLPYPFAKYDQLIVPDFAIGAMENVGAVTFSERFVQRKPSDRFERESRAGVILHEMAHMWFGNLVTKSWWNGLWLNESFATLMAHFALVAATEFTDAWHEFYVDNKQRAYVRDAYVTTHPIEVPVRSTADFFSVFDAITYQKGSSVLKQLAHFVGEENFRNGVARYLAQHAYGNTELDDFVDALSQASGRDLEPWARVWLYEPGFNVLHTRFECDGSGITRLVVEQRGHQRETPLRPHRVDVALYIRGRGGRLTLAETLDVSLDGNATVVDAARSQACPALVFPNHADWTFARVALDDAAVAVVRDRLDDVEDPLSRSMFVQSLFDMTRKGDFALEEYATLASAAAEGEDNLRVLAQLTRSIENVVHTLERLTPDSAEALQRVRTSVMKLSWDRAQEETDPDKVRLWFDLYVVAAHGEANLSRLRGLLRGNVSIPALAMSQDLRWKIVLALSAKGDPDAARRIADEKQRDGSDLGQKMALAADAAQPDPDVKRRWIDELLDDGSRLGLARQRFVMESLFPANQTELQRAALRRILAALPELSRTRDPYFLSSFVSKLLLPMGHDESVAAMSETLENSGTLDSTTLRFLREAHQADEECLALRRSLNTVQR